MAAHQRRSQQQENRRQLSAIVRRLSKTLPPDGDRSPPEALRRRPDTLMVNKKNGIPLFPEASKNIGLIEVRKTSQSNFVMHVFAIKLPTFDNIIESQVAPRDHEVAMQIVISQDPSRHFGLPEICAI